MPCLARFLKPLTDGTNTMTTTITNIARDAFGWMASGPKPLAKALEASCEDKHIVAKFLKHLEAVASSDPVFNLVNQKLSAWDYDTGAGWNGGTANNTEERRTKIYELLRADAALIDILNKKFPPNLNYEAPIVIAREHTPWYDAARQKRQSFYRDAYAGYLREKKNWNEDQINSLEESTRLVTERLSDPESADIYPVKGLVVGYVQSGKTANFTGVVARAADAGYRLIIVLAGTLNILRDQTQTRMDRELIGLPFITAEEDEIYASDIQNFIDHGGLPSDLGAFDWHRLTNRDGDYQRLKHGIQSLEFRRRDKTKPFNHPENLHADSARLLIIKKVPSVLKKVAADLTAIKSKSKLADIPTLIIDDESDQASVNTKKPTMEEIKNRTATNSAIVALLQQLPRAQYVGYTATPFANVFIDPNNEEDLFPRDFIISLPRPGNYMGVADFHDLDRPSRTEAGPNELAFVRDVRGDDDLPGNLQRAIDSFILTGAIKLYRQSLQPQLAKNFRHHTMLVHISHLTGDHKETAEQVETILGSGGYMKGTAWSRLQTLWTKDFAQVCQDRSAGYPIPATFDEIKPFLGECWKRLMGGAKPVLTVNGDAKDNPDFESDSIWKIVVGGAKLSRGYTIEGLTISYYRRRAGAADTLMQMGRWFGFRDGYRDLVRLYMGRSEKVGKKGAIDLFAAFEAVCRDEMEFRDELKKYANPASGKPVLPIQVPPLVPSHLLRPTANNKMYNAKIEFKNFGGVWREPISAPFKEADIRHNQKLFESLLQGALNMGQGTLSVTQEGTNIALGARWATVSKTAMLTFLQAYRWIGGDRSVLQREIDFLGSRNTSVDKWLILYVDGPKNSAEYEACEIKFRVYNRSRTGESSGFGVYSESNHRPLVKYLCGVGDAVANNNTTSGLQSPKQGIFVFYPTREKHNEVAPVTPGFALQFPNNSNPTQIRFGVEVKSRPNDLTAYRK
jgi:hypothetical protein